MGKLLRGKEDELLKNCTANDREAWTKAFKAFPKLGEHLSAKEAVHLMKGLVRNELHFYDYADALEDRVAGGFPPAVNGLTIGYTQITPRGVRDFEQIKGSKLQSILKEQGYSGEGHETKALEDPKCAP